MYIARIYRKMLLIKINNNQEKIKYIIKIMCDTTGLLGRLLLLPTTVLSHLKEENYSVHMSLLSSYQVSFIGGARELIIMLREPLWLGCQWVCEWVRKWVAERAELKRRAWRLT